MKISVTIEGPHACGKTHLARALRDWLVKDYPNVGVLDVSIVERTDADNPSPTITGRRLVIHPEGVNLQQRPKG